MPHFGELLFKLRDARGMSQGQLADRAGLSSATIHRGEKSASCPWRKSVAREVFDALDRREHVDEADTRAYFALAGMTAPTNRQPSQAQQALRILNIDPDAVSIHAWVDRLIEEVGAIRLISALEGLASAWNIDLPPRDRIKRQPLPSAPIPAVRHTVEEPGVRADIYTPTKPPQKPKPTIKRRTA